MPTQKKPGPESRLGPCVKVCLYIPVVDYATIAKVAPPHTTGKGDEFRKAIAAHAKKIRAKQ